MRVGSLDLPEEILSALDEERLVLFAGAGVSIPAPSNLPSFQSLVEELIGRPLQSHEVGQMDRVLGQAKERGRSVHRSAATRLARPESRFNALHQNLVSLFGSAAALRIVTTNFDLHFDNAIAARFGPDSVEIYTAPALPLGSSFKGLVHLHGSLGRSPEDLVLTDADFGRAYLAEGWAGRFVLELFRHYTVLFVGYSYGDTVMSYLTRGLSPGFGRRRFAFTERGQHEKWQLLGIQPVEYDDADDHRALAEGLDLWMTYERRGFLDWDRRLSILVSRDPRALAPDEAGEVEYCLKNPKRAKLFYQYAIDPGWLNWVEDRGWLEPLFALEGDQELHRDLAQWFSTDPLGPRGKTALQIALKRNRPAGWALTTLATQEVQHALRKLKSVDAGNARRAAAWATLIIERSPHNTSPFHLGYWLDYLSPQEHPELAVLILKHLVRCEPSFRDDALLDPEHELGFSLEMRTTANDLRRRWERLRAHIGTLAWPLVSVLTETLEARWRCVVAVEGRTPANDPWGWERSEVELPPESDHRSGRRVGPILEIGKDVLDELLARAPSRADSVIELWLDASSPQLVQLGLYGLAKSSHRTPTRRLARLAKHLPATAPFKAEIFRVLQETYPHLDLPQRARWLKKAERVYATKTRQRQDDPGRQRSAVYEWYNLLVWLSRTTPDDAQLPRAIETVHESYPDFEPRDHPEHDIEVGKAEWVRPTSALTSQEIASLSLDQWLAEMAAARERQHVERQPIDHVRGLLDETGRTASEHLEWGLTIALDLLASERYDNQVWRAILRAWSERACKPAEWTRVLTTLDHPELLAAHPRDVAEVLRALARQKEPATTKSTLLRALRLGRKLLPFAEQTPFALLTLEDWLTQAINHPGGHLAELAVLATGQLLGPSVQQGCGIPRSCRPLLNALVKGTGNAATTGRVILSSRAHYLHWIDPDWATTRLLPLFDWDRDATQAVQAWHGFLAWGRPSAPLLEALTPAAVQLASHLEQLGTERKLYGTFIARAALATPDDPLTKPWLQAFLTKADDDDRAQFAWELDELLESLKPEQKSEIWHDWLDHYLQQRADIPPAPERQEYTALVGWSFNLQEQLAQLVERLEGMPGEGADIDRLLWRLEEGELASSDATLLGRLLLAVLKRCEKIDAWELPHLKTVIKQLASKNAPKNTVHALVEKYVEHGGSEQQELLEAL